MLPGFDRDVGTADARVMDFDDDLVAANWCRVVFQPYIVDRSPYEYFQDSPPCSRSPTASLAAGIGVLVILTGKIP
jgi:hypothetical protein